MIDINGSNASIIDYYKYGFKLLNNSVFTINDGLIESCSTVITNTSEFRISQIDSIVVYFIDNVEVKSVIVSNENDYRVGAGMKSLSTVLYIYPYNLSKKKAHFGIKDLHYFDCGKLNGGFNFVANSPISSFSYTYQVSKDGTVILTGNSTSGTVLNILFTSTYGPGEYVLTGTTTSFGGLTFEKRVFLGVKCEWVDVDKYTLSPNNFSIVRNNQNPSDYSYAKSSNVLLNTQPNGWIQLQPKITNSTPGVSILRTSTYSTSSVAPNPVEQYSFITFKNGINNFLMWTGPSFGYSIIPSNSVMRLMIDATNFKILVNDVLLNSNLNRPLNTIMLRAHSKAQGHGFENVITSFQCRQGQEIFGELKYDLDGYYHIMKNGKINIEFIQEYAPSTLNFTIFNEMDESVKTNADFATITTNPGKNLITIDVSNNTNCLGQGFFYIEVVNDKKEKLYLRFYNDYSGCVFNEEM